MDKLLYLLGPLGCAVMMAAMMWMMRGQHTGHRAGPGAQPDPATQQEIAALRAEVAALRSAHVTAQPRQDQPPWPATGPPVAELPATHG